MRSYEDLKAWQLAHALVIAIYRATDSWPSTERYGLISQARRAAFSIAVNIVEGNARRGPRELRRFLDISIGSLTELRYILTLARDIGYVDRDGFATLEGQRDQVGRVLWGLYRSVLEPARQAKRHQRT